jgi:hypothetical protein
LLLTAEVVCSLSLAFVERLQQNLVR